MAKEFGYCSSGCTRPQFEKQITNISKKYPNAIIIKEVYSPTDTDRTELTKLLAQLEKNDTLIVNSMDRLDRDPQKLLTYYIDMSARGVKLIFINQPYMNTELYQTAYREMVSKAPLNDDTAISEALSHLLGAQVKSILEKSWEDLQQHRGQMRENYKQARLQEKQDGQPVTKKYESRKSFMVKELIRRYNQNYDGSMNDVATMEQIRNEMGTISRNTYYKYKKELANEMI